MPTFEIIKVLDLQKTVSEISSGSNEEEEKELLHVVVKNEGVIRRPSFSLELGGELEVDDDDDGFKTPTSMDHKIPFLKQCPPAPKKLKPKSCPMKMKNKRKELQAHCFRVDLSKEIQLLFPPLVSDFDLHKKMMKKSTQAA